MKRLRTSKTALEQAWVAMTFFGVLFGGIFFYHTWLLAKGYRSKSWAPIEGNLLEVTHYKGGIGLRSSGSSVAIRCSYVADERTNECATVAFGQLTSGALNDLQRWKAGDRIKVWVNPERTDEAVVIPGTAAITVLATTGSGILFGIVLCLAFKLARNGESFIRKKVSAADFRHPSK